MNILIFGPNGSGKGNYGGQLLKKNINLPILNPELFSGKTSRGELTSEKKAKEFIDRGDLVL